MRELKWYDLKPIHLMDITAKDAKGKLLVYTVDLNLLMPGTSVSIGRFDQALKDRKLATSEGQNSIQLKLVQSAIKICKEEFHATCTEVTFRVCSFPKNRIFIVDTDKVFR